MSPMSQKTLQRQANINVFAQLNSNMLKKNAQLLIPLGSIKSSMHYFQSGRTAGKDFT